MAGSPRFRHLDDLKWQEVRRQQHGDRTVSVYEKWPEFSERYLTVYAKYEPGMMVHKHGHNSDHVVFVIEGDIMCGDVHCPAGTHIALDQGDAFGPFIAGPNGAVMFEVMMGDPRSWPADPAGFEKLLAEKRAVKLPDPPIELPDWLEDTRR